MLKSPLSGAMAVTSSSVFGALLSVFTTRTLSVGRRTSVTSKRKAVKAPLCWPSFLPLSHTSATMLAPSNSSQCRAPVAGAAKTRRYQPRPRLYAAVALVVAASFAFQV